jgi:ATP-dependent exoDNAse (exonuclease V) alpha subunit
LTPRDVLVIDEAGMIGTRQLERYCRQAERPGQVVLVGDPEQLQAIEAGAAFRSLTGERHAGRDHGIRRQHEDWQRDATRALATADGRGHAYEEHGMVAVADREQAREALWSAGTRSAWPIRTDPDHPHHTNAEVRDLNGRARSAARRRRAGEDVRVSAERGRASSRAATASCS